MGRSKQVIAVSLLAACMLGGCGNKALDELKEVAQEQQWEFAKDQKTFNVILVQDGESKQYHVESGDDGNAYMWDKEDYYYFVDGNLVKYNEYTKETEYLGRGNFDLDYMKVYGILEDLETVLSDDGKVSVKKSGEYVNVKFDGPFSHNPYTAELQFDDKYIVEQGTIQFAEDKVDVYTMWFTDSTVDIPDEVMEAIANK